MKVQAIVPAAGIGERLDAGEFKPLVELESKPLFIYVLEALEQSPCITNSLVVCHPERVDAFVDVIDKYGFTKVAGIVPGGLTRRESVYHGLEALDADTELVLIHDGARPLITPDIIEKTIAACENEEAVTVGVPIVPTIKRVNESDQYVIETLNRDELWEVQTPQVFKRNIILRAHEQVNQCKVTDDASLVESLGIKVKMIRGAYSNVKITTKEDLVIAKQLLDRGKNEQ